MSVCTQTVHHELYRLDVLKSGFGYRVQIASPLIENHLLKIPSSIVKHKSGTQIFRPTRSDPTLHYMQI
jgi:hypothetical protein